MSHIHYIFCDGLICKEQSNHIYSDVQPSFKTRENLERIDWHVSQPGGKDYCPACWVKKQEEANE